WAAHWYAQHAYRGGLPHDGLHTLGCPWATHGQPVAGSVGLPVGMTMGGPSWAKNAAHGMPTMSCPWAVYGLLMGGRNIKTSKVWEAPSRGAGARQHEQKET
ncbi:unnamed protein product, partial [Ectocarpus sp. 8 AP-2014]